MFNRAEQNPKSEYPKSETASETNKSQIQKIQNTETEEVRLKFAYFCHLNLFRISDFVLRIFCSWRLCPSIDSGW
jgi:hypothetical protein